MGAAVIGPVLVLLHAALMAFGMAWQTGWSLVLGFTISALLQVTVRSSDLQRAFGGDGPRELALAAVAGAASSSCSYASAAIARTLFKKGAALATALAFMIASTNLVLELGLVLLTTGDSHRSTRARGPPSAPMRLVRMMTPPGLNTRTNSSSAASGFGTAVTTYCATTTSKLASGKSRCSASITDNPSMLARPSRSARSRALASMVGEMSMPVMRVARP